jgi:hypothetical protein
VPGSPDLSISHNDEPMTDSVPASQPTLRTRLRDKLPEILIEAGSIVAALLLALAVGAWHEQSQAQARADEARAAILAEVRTNGVELDRIRANLKDNIGLLEASAAVEARPGDRLDVKMGLALLSESAWRAALATGALAHVDYAWTTHVGRVYELQELVTHAQSLAVDQLAGISDASTESQRVIAQNLLSRQRALAQMADDLDGTYRDLLSTTR